MGSRWCSVGAVEIRVSGMASQPILPLLPHHMVNSRSQMAFLFIKEFEYRGDSCSLALRVPVEWKHEDAEGRTMATLAGCRCHQPTNVFGPHLRHVLVPSPRLGAARPRCFPFRPRTYSRTHRNTEIVQR
jgi:hypothetical protein